MAQGIREALRVAAVEGSSAADAMTEALVSAGTRAEEEAREELRPSVAPAGVRAIIPSAHGIEHALASLPSNLRPGLDLSSKTNSVPRTLLSYKNV